MLALLEQRRSAGHRIQGVMHCWGGTPAEMHAFLAHGLYISFSGTVTLSHRNPPVRPTGA